jgi:hypothetical protein
VTWIGIDGYYYRPSDTFFSIFDMTVARVRAFTTKPVLLGAAVGDRRGTGCGKSAKIVDLFSGMYQYNTLGLVGFDIAQDNGIYHQNWRIEENPSGGNDVPACGLCFGTGTSMTIAGPVPVVMVLGMAAGLVLCELGKTLPLSDDRTVPFISGVPDRDDTTVRNRVRTLRGRLGGQGTPHMPLDGRWVQDMQHGATASWAGASAAAATSGLRALLACPVRTDTVPGDEATL